MEQDAKRGSRGRNTYRATNGHPDPGDGSLATAQVDETQQPEASVDLAGNFESREFVMGSNQSTRSCPPRQTNYDPASSPVPIQATKSREPAPIFEPPVTKATLSELDVNKIVHNPKLRHDINFDPDLHFRPNLDGEKGLRKKQKADSFWDTMRSQLQNYLTDREGFEKELGDAEWCLPVTLKAIRGILETLVPQRDRASVEEAFNVDFLMQQFRKGVADLVKLATWLSNLLKRHCAPMRDDWVDNMVTQLSDGDRNSNVGQLVDGMLSLMAVLEAMKLDVANHQIRCLRPLLIEDTVHFEQKFFMKKIATSRVNIAEAHAWFKRASSLPNVGSLDAFIPSRGHTWDFIKGLVNLTLPSQPSDMIPHTFIFDEDRLHKLRSDLLDLINLEICVHMFRRLEATSRLQELRFPSYDDTPATSFASSPCNRPASLADDCMLPSLLLSDHHFISKPKFYTAQEPDHFSRAPSGQQVWVQNAENEITTSESQSPHSSPSTSPSTPSTYPSTPPHLSLPVSDSAFQARSSFQAILASDTTSEKWKSLSSPLALQILRSTNTPLTNLPQFEYHLAFHVSNPRSKLYQEAEDRVLSQLFPVLQKLVETFTPLTSLQIFEAATVSKAAPAGKSDGPRDTIAEIATRIAHIGILHWRVWAPLAYLVDPDADEENLEPCVGRAT